jgi:ectoine hydroxylase-related dioxygenase (phytanoyl-CoA dioxygenase family)
MSMPGSLGQQLHKDSLVEDRDSYAKDDDPLNGAVNLNGAQNLATVFPKYPYQPFPACILENSHEPLDWDALPKVKVPWKLGDFMVWRPDLIHAAPPNPNKKYARFILFMTTAPSNGVYSDAGVITEAVFRQMRDEAKVGGGGEWRE